jgi:hypothetical protein
MKEKDHKNVGRRALLTNMGVAAVAGIAATAGPASAQVQQSSNAFKPARHSKDSWFNDLKGEHRVFIDSSTVQGGGSALRFANNIIVSHMEEYEGKSSDYALVVCFRHASTPYGFGHAIWEKYGELINRDTSLSAAPTSNPMYVSNSHSGSNTIPKVLDLGVNFAICNRATRNTARRIASATGTSADDVYAELVAGAIPNSRFVAAGVLAATRSQEYGYSLLYAE